MRLLFTRCILIISMIIVPVVGFTKNMVSKIQESSNLDLSTNDLAGQISQQMVAGSKTAIAVNDFVDLDGNVTRLGRFLAEELVTKLFQTQKYRVIERPLLNKALTDLKLNLSNLVNPASAKQLGRFLGVDAIVTGTITDLSTRVKVNARLIS